MSDIKAFFEEKLPAKFKDNPDAAEGMAGSYEFVVDGDDGGTWVVDFPEGGGMNVTPGATEEPGCRIKVTAEDWGGIVSGELDPTTAFMSGKLMIEGDMAMAMKLQPILSGI